MKTTQRIAPVAMFLALTLGALAPTGARAAGIGVYGVLGLTGSSETPPAAPLPPDYGGRFNGGLGAFVRGDLVPGLDLELGATFLKRTYNVKNVGETIVGNMDYSTLEVPLMVRLTAVPILTAGAGVYGAFKLGQTNYDAALTAGGLQPNLKGFDFGLIGAVGVEFPFGPIGLFAEGRYLFGLANLDDNGNSLQTRNVEAVGGVRIGLP